MSRTHSGHSPPRLPFIDGLRGIAILGVLACHTLDHSFKMPPGYDKTWTYKFIMAGQYGVTLFFIVSALTLFRSSRERFLVAAHPYLDFYTRRAFRIFPFYWLACFLYAYLNGFSFWEILPNLTMYFGFTRFHGWSLFDADWSIFVEEVFYVTLPFLFKRVGDRRKATEFIVIAYAIKVIWRILGYTQMKRWGINFIIDFPFNHWPSFAFGIALYWWSEGILASALFTRASLRVAIESAGAILLFFALFQCEWLIPPAFALFILLATSEKTLFGRLARAHWLGYFGRCCYSIYLLHFLIMSLLDPIRVHSLNYLGVKPIQVGLAMSLWFPVVLLVCLFVGTLTFYAIEQPCIAAARALTSGWGRQKGKFAHEADGLFQI